MSFFKNFDDFFENGQNALQMRVLARLFVPLFRVTPPPVSKVFCVFFDRGNRQKNAKRLENRGRNSTTEDAENDPKKIDSPLISDD